MAEQKSTAAKTKADKGEKNKEDKTKTASKKQKYIYAVGRRKSAIAQVRLYDKGKGEIIINNKDVKNYFPTNILQTIVYEPLELVNLRNKHDITVKVKGGGSRGQAEAVRHGLTRTLVKLSEDFKKPLKQAGFLTRDPRVKERKKPGLKRARRAPQWQKR